jgi:hypothetical protein
MAKASTQKKTASTKYSNRRKHIRFKPDPGAIALILTDSKGLSLAAPVHCLILEESYSGAGLVAANSESIQKGQHLKMKIGLLSPMECEVKWVKKLGPLVVSFGVEYQE